MNFDFFCFSVSIYRSTKSEKMSMLTRGGDIEIEPYYCLPIGTTFQNPLAAHANAASKAANVPWSQPTSPTPPSRFSNGPLSPTHAYRLTYPKKNDDGMYLRCYSIKHVKHVNLNRLNI